MPIVHVQLTVGQYREFPIPIIAKANTTIIATMKFSRIEPLNTYNTLSIQGYLVPSFNCSNDYQTIIVMYNY